MKEYFNDDCISTEKNASAYGEEAQNHWPPTLNPSANFLDGTPLMQ